MNETWHVLSFTPHPATSFIGPMRKAPPLSWDQVAGRDALASGNSSLQIELGAGGIVPVPAREGHPRLDLFAPEHVIMPRETRCASLDLCLLFPPGRYALAYIFLVLVLPIC